MQARMLAMAIGLTIAAREARAESSFQVNPTMVSLSREVPAEAVVITNHGTQALRVQVDATTWHEDADGVMQLVATTDLVVRPSLLEIEPGRSKTVRVGDHPGRAPRSRAAIACSSSNSPIAGPWRAARSSC